MNTAEPVNEFAGARQRGEWLVLTLIFVVSLAVRALRSSTIDVVADEIWTRSVAFLPLANAWEFVYRDAVHPPFFYVVERLVMHLVPDNIWGLRAVTLVAGASIPPLIFWGARKCGVTPTAAWLATALAIVSPLLLQMSTFARSYSLVAFLATLHLILSVAWWRQQPARPAWHLVILGMVIGLTHAFGVVYLGGASLLFLALPENRPLWRRWILLFVPAMVVSLAWFGPAFVIMHGRAGLAAKLAWTGEPGLSDMIYAVGQSLGLPAFRMAERTILALWALVGAIVLMGKPWERKEGRLALVAIAVAWFPFVVQCLVVKAPLRLPLWGARHDVITNATFYFALALALSRGAVALPRGLRLVAQGGVALAVCFLAFATPAPPENIGPTFQYVRGLAKQRTIVTPVPYGIGTPLNFYFDRRCVESRLMVWQLGRNAPDSTGFCRVRSTEDAIGDSLAAVVYRRDAPSDRHELARFHTSGWTATRDTTIGPDSLFVVELARRTPK